MHSDFKDLLSCLSEADAQYIVVGAHALAAHGHVRATKDIDIWINPTQQNARRVYKALAKFGAPLGELTVEDLATPGIIFQIGVAPIRIDIITRIDGVEFDEAWESKLTTAIDQMEVNILSREHLLQNKRAAGRLQDLADVETLEKMS